MMYAVDHASCACIHVEDCIFVALWLQTCKCIHQLILVIQHASYACIRVEDPACRPQARACTHDLRLVVLEASNMRAYASSIAYSLLSGLKKADVCMISGLLKITLATYVLRIAYSAHVISH